MGARVLYLGFGIPIEMSAASTLIPCACGGGPIHRYARSGYCSRHKDLGDRVFYDWQGRTICWGCLSDSVKVKTRRGLQAPRSVTERASETMKGDERIGLIALWGTRRAFWDRALG